MATGIKTRSQSVKDALQARNYYTPTNVYDINNNSLTRALNAVNQYSNFDLRNSFITTYVEGSLVQDSPIVKNAQMQQLKFLGLNTAQKIVQNQIPVFNGNNGTLLQKAKDLLTGKAYRFRSLSITSKNEIDKNIVSVNNLASLVVGGIDHGYSKSMFEKIYGSNLIGSNPDTFATKEIMDKNYELLGEFTKDTIVNFSNQNFYGPRKTSDPTKYGNTINKLINGSYFNYGSSDPGNTQRTYLQERVAPSNVGLEFKDGTYDNPVDEFLSYNGNKLANDKKIEQDFGFGTTERYNSETGRMEPIPDILNSETDITDPQGANAKRGILYFTKRILESKHGHELAGDNITYTEGRTPSGEDIVTYRGRSACRSWTNKLGTGSNDQYGSDLKTQLLTYNQWKGGNNVQNSVMFDSVRPHIHAKFTDKEEDKRRYMFSMENLAFDTASYANLPKSEQGFFGGRVMWFAPYGIEFSEQTAANWESHKFVGRPEPVYSYNGSERSGTLSFMLIMDYPLSDYKLDKMDYTNPDIINTIYKSCDENGNVIFTPEDGVRKIKNVKSVVITETVDSNSELTDKMNDLELFFDNNSNTIDINYNPYNVNDNYNSKINIIKQIIESPNCPPHKIILNGYCSAKYKVNYNAKLGFRRAYNLMKGIYNGSLKNPDNFVDETFEYKKDSKGNRIEITSGDTNSTTFTFLASDGSGMEFIINSFGETLSNAEDTKSVEAVKSRKANVISITNKRNSTSQTLTNVSGNGTSITTSGDTATIIQSNPNNYQEWESQSTIGKSGKDLTDINFAKPNSKGSGYMDTFIPTYHSQTPYDFHNRLTFLNQCVRPGRTLNSSDKQYVPTNSVFGKQPVIILRLGDFLHTKLIITNLDIKYEQLWDLNPNGHGVQPMVAKVNLAVKIIGGQSLATPIAQLQNAISNEFYANSTYKPIGTNGYSPFENNNQTSSSIDKENAQITRNSAEAKRRQEQLDKLK